MANSILFLDNYASLAIKVLNVNAKPLKMITVMEVIQDIVMEVIYTIYCNGGYIYNTL